MRNLAKGYQVLVPGINQKVAQHQVLLLYVHVPDILVDPAIILSLSAT